MVVYLGPMPTASEIEAAARRRRFRASIAEKAAELEAKKRPPTVIEQEAAVTRRFAAERDAQPLEFRTVNEIQRAVAKFYKMTVLDIKSDRRSGALARHVAIYLCRELTPFSLPRLGHFFGGRDHSTVLYACRRIKAMSRRDPDFAFDLATLFESLGGHPE